jgi:ABC-type dipeptide/oligopeptide/nickel transport system ATPase component
MEHYTEYLNLLRQLTHELEELSELAQKKTAAVRQDDLEALNRVIQQEQAISLALRSTEQKRQKTLEAMNMTDVPLNRLASRYPEDMRPEAKQTADKLVRQYRFYQGVSDAARNMLECNLHEVEKTLKGMGAGQPLDVHGDLIIEAPSRMKTDFRA